jgi:hypothetical protein
MEQKLQLSLSDLYKCGFTLIPCGRDKKPLLTTWKPYQSRRPTGEDVDAWRKELHPPCWAVVTGGISGVVVLDFDGKQGTETQERLRLTPHVRTGSGGSHVYFQHPGWRVPTVNAKSKRELGRRYPGLDIRADGGYAVCHGRNAKGEYTWLRLVQPDSLSILPTDLRELLGLTHPPAQIPGEPLSSSEVTPSATRAAVSALIEKGLRDALALGRNDAGFQLACSLRDQGFSQEEAEEAMREYCAHVPTTNQRGELEPYTVREALASLRQAYKRARGGSAPQKPHNNGNAPVKKTPTECLAESELPDGGRAEMVARSNGKGQRFCIFQPG